MATLLTDRFPVRITYVNQVNGDRQCSEMVNADDAVPPIPPDHAVVVQYADGSGGYIPATINGVRKFSLSAVNNDESE